MKRHRQHINPLKMTALVPREERLALPHGVEVEVELGCGDGRFIISRAQQNPRGHFVGLDIRELFLDDARALAVELGGTEPANLTLAYTNLLVDAERLFAPQRVRRLFINFPDPWFKRRQHNRRWLTPEILDHLVRALEPGGQVFFQSDVWDLALEALGLLEGNVGLANAREPWTFARDNPFGVKSSRELACEEEGLKIWRLLFEKKT